MKKTSKTQKRQPQAEPQKPAFELVEDAGDTAGLLASQLRSAYSAAVTAENTPANRLTALALFELIEPAERLAIKLGLVEEAAKPEGPSELLTTMKALLEFADNGTPIHPGAEVISDARTAVLNAERSAR